MSKFSEEKVEQKEPEEKVEVAKNEASDAKQNQQDAAESKEQQEEPVQTPTPEEHVPEEEKSQSVAESSTEVSQTQQQDEVDQDEVDQDEVDQDEVDQDQVDDTELEDASEEQQQAIEDYPEMPTPVPNTILTGKVVQIGTDEVLVDIGYKYEGHIPQNEIGLKQGQELTDVVSVDQDIDVWVLKVDDAEGNVVLSKRRADAHKTWVELEKKYEQGESIAAVVSQVVKGGLLVDLGVRGFIPASHVSRNFVDDLENYVGQTLQLKIIELDRHKNNVVLSHKDLLEEQYQQVKAKVFDNLEENSIIEGIVRRITDFGAFVDIGDGVEGLLHVSEMAYSRVKHPSDVVSEGDTIKVMVLGIDKENERISLGLKQTLTDPWDTIEERYQVGNKVTGEVTRVVDFGAFVKLEDGVEGLIHISQLSHRHVAKTEEVVKPGDQVEVKVISLDPQAKRIGLSIRELEPKPEPPKPPEKKQQKQEADIGENNDDEELTTSLGDMFSDIFKDK